MTTNTSRWQVEHYELIPDVSLPLHAIYQDLATIWILRSNKKLSQIEINNLNPTRVILSLYSSYVQAFKAYETSKLNSFKRFN